MPIDLRMLFIDALASANEKPARRRRGSARCYGPPCEIPGCDGKTVGNKPYCLEHVHLMPYAAQIQNREAEREEEIKTAGGPPLDGHVAQDLLGAIKLTQSSIPALARDLRLPHATVEDLVERMITAGLVAVRRSKRSVYVKRATNPDRPEEEPALEEEYHE